MIDFERFEDNTKHIIMDKVFDEIDTSELYMQIESLNDFDKLRIKFKHLVNFSVIYSQHIELFLTKISFVFSSVRI